MRLTIDPGMSKYIFWKYLLSNKYTAFIKFNFMSVIIPPLFFEYF